MQVSQTVLPARFRTPQLVLELATNESDIRQSQQLRYQVFMGDNYLQGRKDRRLDIDKFDDYCEHLIVRDYQTREVVACTRILFDDKAQLVGGFYSETEFDISTILRLPGAKMELGRTCVHPDYRDGSAIRILWSGLAKMVLQRKVDYLFGCASIDMRDRGYQAHAIATELLKRFGAQCDKRVYPYHRLPPANDAVPIHVSLPPLIKAYLRLGAKICGEPCMDPVFSVADLFVLLDITNLETRYARHFVFPHLRECGDQRVLS